MNDDNRRLFERVAAKMGWKDPGGLDRAEKKLINTIGKSRRDGISGHRPVDPSEDLKNLLCASESEDEPEKENLFSESSGYRTKPLSESSDDDFDQFLVGKATPRGKPAAQKSYSAKKKEKSPIVVSSDADSSFEKFLQRVKTPNAKPKKTSDCGSEDSLKHFIVDDCSSDDDFVDTKITLKAPKKVTTPAARPPQRKPLSQVDCPVFLGDSDDDEDNVVTKSTWRTRHSKPKTSTKTNSRNAVQSDKDEDSPMLPFLSAPSPFSLNVQKNPPSPKRTYSAPPKLDNLSSSDDEFTSLLDRLKKKNKIPSSTFSPKTVKEETPQRVKSPVRSNPLKPTVSQTEPRHGPSSRFVTCKTPGCFLESLSNPGSSYSQKFKQNKEELTAKLYQLYNTTVFDNKLPVDMSVSWNKKMRKTAGYCITGQERGGGARYARIELSVKVCDSADRLRDTLIHEMCHAATWLINSVRDGHGSFWKLYARKSTVVHPELPMVTRCHSYDIKYKFQYQCTRCKNTIGRHSKSLDTQRFVCALCKGYFVLLTPSKPRALTLFASFVKDNYGTVKQEMAGQSHAEVMRKLSADFASKTKLSQSSD